MKIDIYGFKATVHKDGKWYIGEISALHVHDQAASLRELENELKDAVDTSVKFLTEKKDRKSIKSVVIRSLFAKA